jgi:F-type H+-transporting ATPase subunit epsilon
MQLQLVTLSGIKLDTEVYEVILPTTDGEIGVFPGHEPLVTVAKSGMVAVRHRKEDADHMRELFVISDGIIEITGDTIKLLVDEADHSDEIVESEAKAALDRALKMKEDSKDQVSLDKALQLIERQTVRLKVADIRRRHKN